MITILLAIFFPIFLMVSFSKIISKTPEGQNIMVQMRIDQYSYLLIKILMLACDASKFHQRSLNWLYSEITKLIMEYKKEKKAVAMVYDNPKYWVKILTRCVYWLPEPWSDEDQLQYIKKIENKVKVDGVIVKLTDMANSILDKEPYWRRAANKMRYTYTDGILVEYND